MTVLCENLKRLRLAKKLTQEQAAEALGVSAQSISRWERGTSLPDATMLPGIARLYGVTIDDLYREASVAYDNYASRLCSVFEASHRPEDFMQAEMEYRKLLRSGEYSTNDLRSYGILHQYMMQLLLFHHFPMLFLHHFLMLLNLNLVIDNVHLFHHSYYLMFYNSNYLNY